MYELFQNVINQDRLPVAKEINFIFSTLKFIKPVGVTVLGNISSWLLANGVRVTYTWPPYLNDAMQFLDDSQYFKAYLKETIRPNASVRSTTVPLKLVTVDASYQWSEQVSHWLAGKINVTITSLANITMCLHEIFNNISDHSTQSIGSAFIQHYPRKDEVSIAISDFGVGIPFNIQNNEPFLNDAQALERAVQHGFSTKSTPRNRGAGLHTLIYNVVMNNRGCVYIHSNYGILECRPGDNEIEYISKLSPVLYPGTLIEVNLRTDTIENIVEDEEDFQWNF